MGIGRIESGGSSDGHIPPDKQEGRELPKPHKTPKPEQPDVIDDQSDPSKGGMEAVPTEGAGAYLMGMIASAAQLARRAFGWEDPLVREPRKTEGEAEDLHHPQDQNHSKKQNPNPGDKLNEIV